MSLYDAIDVYDTKQLNALTKEQLDSLPCGTIRVDDEGVILFYSRTHAALTNREPEAVLGRNLFSDVAPCTVVPEFYGRFRHGVLTGDLNTSFEFIFDFEMDPVCRARRPHARCAPHVAAQRAASGTTRRSDCRLPSML